MDGFTDGRARRALYYPYISIRDANWLKATLLAFGQVQRMVPTSYRPAQDDPDIRRYENLDGPFGPLVRSADMNSPGVWRAQSELEEKLEHRLDSYQRRYGHHATVSSLGYNADGFQIHKDKLFGALPDFLLRHELAWKARERVSDRELWLTVHPQLGAAILSTLAVPIAELSSLDIVTDDPNIHKTLIRSGNQQPFDAILREPMRASNDATGRLLHIVIASNFFDFRQLTADDLVNLLRDRAGLTEVRRQMAEVLEHYAATADPRELHQILEQAAQRATEEWIRSTKRLPARIVGPAQQVLGASVQFVTDLVSHRATKTLVDAGRLTILLVQGWRKIPALARGPYRYLSSIAAASGTLSGGLFLPAWGQLATRETGLKATGDVR